MIRKALFIALVLASPVLAMRLAPATIEDIVAALGPDATGLSIHQEAFPDLFSLTTSHIEENPKQFFVEQPYKDGPWKGGKIVIEYARDLSYTLVSVYDKKGVRQRIYSVRSKEEGSAPSASAAATSSSGEVPDLEATPEASSTSATFVKTAAAKAPPASSVKVGMLPINKSVGHAEVKKEVEYTWDDQQKQYVAVKAALPDIEVVPEPAAPEWSATSAKTTSSESPSSVKTPSKTEEDEYEEVVVVEPARSKAEKVKVGDTMWVEKSDEKPKKIVKRIRRKKKHAVPAQPPAPVVAQQKPPDEVPSAPAPEKTATAALAPSVATTVTAAVKAAVISPTTIPERTPDLVVMDEPASKPARMPTPPAPTSTPPAPTPVTKGPTESEVPSTEELLAGTPEKPSKEAPHSPAVSPPPATEAKAAPGPDTSESDAWVPKPAPKPIIEDTVQVVPSKEPVKLAMAAQPLPPVDNSVDHLLEMAKEKKGSIPHESDAWVPQQSDNVVPDADIKKELAKIRQKNSAPVPRPMPKIHHDVNNPEEGVLPVSSFEKSSGSMYGRHREYERKFYPGKKAHTKAPLHDFYVDEVDRKKEFHNIYYYVHLKGRAPKLVAVEHHTKVYFMTNYDIEKEDAGKITVYN